MPLFTQTFVGRKQELEQWSNLLADSPPVGQAVVIVGKYGMGKTWLLDQMIQQAQCSDTLKCYAVRYVMVPGESPGMILRVILDDMFQAARYEAGALDTEGKRFGQWLRIYRSWGLFRNRTKADFLLLDQLRFDSRKNIFDQFTHRLELLSDLLPEHGRLLVAVDPELDTSATRVELWTQIAKNLPPNVIFLFAQRFKDSLAINEEFQSLPNVHFIPSLQTNPQGLTDLQDDETEQLLDAYLPMLKDKSVDRKAILNHFHLYRNHPYAVHAALDLLLAPGFTRPDQLPKAPMPAAVCPLQWQGIQAHPLHRDALRLFKAYAVLEIPVLDETACWVADITLEKLEAILKDPFLGSMIRCELAGRQLYHHHLMAFVRSLLYAAGGTLVPEAEELHHRAMVGYDDLTCRTLKPDPVAVVRLAEHALAVGGPTLFAEILCQCAESFLTLGFHQTYAALIDRALVLISPLSTETAKLHFQLGQLRRKQGDNAAAVQHYEAALQTARKIADQDLIALSLFGLGRIFLENEHLVEADMWLRDAITYYEALDDMTGLAEALVLFAEVQWLQGSTQQAETSLKTALEAVGKVRNYRLQAKTMSGVYLAWGRMYDQLGNIERSTEQYHKALDLTKDIYDQEAEAELQISLGSLFERIGNLKSAEEHILRAMSIHQDLNLLERWAEDNLRMAQIADMRGKPELREFHLGQAKQMYRQLGNKKILEEIAALTK